MDVKKLEDGKCGFQMFAEMNENKSFSSLYSCLENIEFFSFSCIVPVEY